MCIPVLIWHVQLVRVRDGRRVSFLTPMDTLNTMVGLIRIHRLSDALGAADPNSRLVCFPSYDDLIVGKVRLMQAHAHFTARVIAFRPNVYRVLYTDGAAPCCLDCTRACNTCSMHASG